MTTIHKMGSFNIKFHVYFDLLVANEFFLDVVDAW